MFGGRSNTMAERGGGAPGTAPQTPAKPGRKIFKSPPTLQGHKKAHQWYASFCFRLTFRFDFCTIRSGSVARFVLRIINEPFIVH